MESNEVLTMRAMAWQRAKGELNAMLATYWPDAGFVATGGMAGAPSSLQDMQDRVRTFVADVEENL
jgi:hypothetical protein